jgi:hypothetical protein
MSEAKGLLLCGELPIPHFARDDEVWRELRRAIFN